MERSNDDCSIWNSWIAPSRDVLGGGADGFIADVQAVDFNAGGAPEAAAEGDGRKTVLGGIEVAAILDLHAGFELGEIEEVAAVDGKVLDLLRGQDSLHGGLFGVHLNFGSLDFDHLTCSVQLAA